MLFNRSLQLAKHAGMKDCANDTEHPMQFKANYRTCLSL